MTLVTRVVVACSNPPLPQASPSTTAPSADCQIIKHDVGSAEICNQPQRIVALSPYILDMMLSLGVEPIGYSSADISKDMLRRAKFDDPAEQIPYLGQYLTTQLVNLGDRHSPSLEVLTQLQPDLILGETWQGSQGKYSLLSKIAPTVLVDDQKGGWEHSIEIINQALDKEEKLRQVKNDYRARIATVREQLALVASKFPQILLVSSGDLSRAIYPYEDSEFSRLFEELNFQLVNTENFFSDNSGLSLETVPQLNADIIIVVAWNDDKKDDARGWEKLEQEWGKIPVLDNMAASQAGRVFFLDARLSTIRGPLAAGVILDSYLRVLTPLKKQ